MAVVVRSAVVADAAAIARVNTESWRETYAGLLPPDFLTAREVSPDPLARQIKAASADGARHAIWVAELDGTVVGFAASGPDLKQPALGCLYAIYLLRPHQGGGVGYRLYRAAVEWLAAGGYTEAVLWVLDTNDPAVAYYQRQGWQLDGTARTEDVGIEIRVVGMRTALSQAPPTAR